MTERDREELPNTRVVRPTGGEDLRSRHEHHYCLTETALVYAACSCCVPPCYFLLTYCVPAKLFVQKPTNRYDDGRACTLFVYAWRVFAFVFLLLFYFFPSPPIRSGEVFSSVIFFLSFSSFVCVFWM